MHQIFVLQDYSMVTRAMAQVSQLNHKLARESLLRGVARNIERGFLNVCARENNINIHNLSAKLRVVSGL